MKVQTCHLPCIVAKIMVNRSTGEITFRCPKECHFRRYEDRPGPIDRWLS